MRSLLKPPYGSLTGERVKAGVIKILGWNDHQSFEQATYMKVSVNLIS